MKYAADGAEEGEIMLALDDDKELDAGLEPGAEARGGRAEEAGAEVVEEMVGGHGVAPK